MWGLLDKTVLSLLVFLGVHSQRRVLPCRFKVMIMRCLARSMQFGGILLATLAQEMQSHIIDGQVYALRTGSLSIDEHTAHQNRVRALEGGEQQERNDVRYPEAHQAVICRRGNELMPTEDRFNFAPYPDRRKHPTDSRYHAKHSLRQRRSLGSKYRIWLTSECRWCDDRRNALGVEWGRSRRRSDNRLTVRRKERSWYNEEVKYIIVLDVVLAYQRSPGWLCLVLGK